MERRAAPHRCEVARDWHPLFLASHPVSSRTFCSRSQSTAPRLARRGQWNLWLPPKAEQMQPSKISINMPSLNISGRRKRPLTKTGTIV
jgi:hypothetical protein